MAAFKKAKTKSFRKRRHSSSNEEDSEDEEDIGSKLRDIKELQKMRGRPNGVDIISLSACKDETRVTVDTKSNDPFKMKTGGGFVDMKKLKKNPIKIDDEEAIGTAFAAETNRRDEDTEMLKYVEVELAKAKGHLQTNEEDMKQTKKQADSLYVLPDHLKVESSHKRTEDMLSNQMLSGIPEVDLGIDAKIRNIEATEDAKQKLMEERMKKREKEVSDFVPTNMAANFVQHNRFNIEDTAPLLKKEEAPKPEPLRVGDVERLTTPATDGKKAKGDKATDDFHFEKFRKHMRR